MNDLLTKLCDMLRAENLRLDILTSELDGAGLPKNVENQLKMNNRERQLKNKEWLDQANRSLRAL